jgi:glycosyltransferase involved in cell wall biosynthesis
MEAMACELPVISSDSGNAKRILSDGRGILLNKYTDEEIAIKCEYLLKNDVVSKNMGKLARKYVKENYSWDKISIETERLYKNLLKK